MKNAVYPGSFDPITNGHYDIIMRSSNLFDNLIILISNNPAKKYLFNVEQRVYIAKELTKDLKNVKVMEHQGLLIDFLVENEIYYIIRGLRAVS
ncbi:MAG: pantetheine-phosphate adenylyltransferase, partial [Exilispira sp.]|nr:pantetheine-phosphate adenylyltransferase [Exilispira sp.]